jgi:GMP synthase-like glutamine amidotransferase
MRILSLVHGPLVRSELFGEVAAGEGHELDEWSVVDRQAPPRPVEDYDAVFVFGGHMNVDQEEQHPWLPAEVELVADLVARQVPLLGVCLGGQIVAKGAGAHVGPYEERERGFVRVELTADAADDPLFGALPREFDVFALHEQSFHVPDGGVELARSAVCVQAFRLGQCAWAIQFHPEVHAEQVARWLDRNPEFPDAETILAELRDRGGEWRELGTRLCRAFLAVAARRSAAVPAP